MSDLLTFSPGLILIAVGLGLLALPRLVRPYVIVGAPLITLAAVLALPDGATASLSWLGYTLTPVRADALAQLFALIFAIMTVIGAIFALSQERTGELAAAFIYAGSAMGVVLAGDLLTLFVYWELMAIGSLLVIWHGGGAAAYGAGLRYAAIHFLGGVLLMAGIAGEVATTGAIAFEALDTSTWPRVLILAGILVNAGAPPLSAWVADAYPEASWSGMIFLAAFTTKTAVYTLIRGFPGAEVLIVIGLAMVVYGVVYAVLENDMRRILAYSIVGQVGFMVTAVGIGTELALNAAAAHAFSHIIYKALLLMAAGAVLYRTGKRKCSELGGLYRTMPLTCACGVLGGLAIAAVPLTAGYPTKSLISAAAGDAEMSTAWFILTAASAVALLYVGLRFPWLVFFHRDVGLRPAEAPQSMLVAMGLLSVLCLAIGVAPGLLFDRLPYAVTYDPYKIGSVLFQLQLLLASGITFVLARRWLVGRTTITLDFDWFYRVFGRELGRRFNRKTAHAWQTTAAAAVLAAQSVIMGLYRHHGPQGILGRNWPTGNMAFWTTVLLGGSLIAYYLR